MEIIELDKSYKGRSFKYSYKTKYYYDLEIIEDEKETKFNIIRKKFTSEMDKEFTTSLYEDYLTDPVVFAIFKDKRIIAYIELSIEDWNNRLRVAGIYVEEKYRKKDIGKKLMAKAIEYGKENKKRALVLETQSCNYPAISFYKKNGFKIIGFDTIHYSNKDIENSEFRLEMGLLLE